MNARTEASAKAWAEVEAQGVLQPGQTGWWKVWGARPQDVRAGDLVLAKANPGRTDDADVMLIAEAHGTTNVVQYGFTEADGARFYLGALCPVIVLRRETRNVLAASL